MGSGGERRAGISSPKHLEVGGGCYYRAVLEKAAFPSTCAEQPLAPAPSCPACEGEAALRLSALQLQTGRVELLGRGELPAKVCKKTCNHLQNTRNAETAGGHHLGELRQPSPHPALRCVLGIRHRPALPGGLPDFIQPPSRGSSPPLPAPSPVATGMAMGTRRWLMSLLDATSWTESCSNKSLLNNWQKGRLHEIPICEPWKEI